MNTFLTYQYIIQADGKCEMKGKEKEEEVENVVSISCVFSFLQIHLSHFITLFRRRKIKASGKRMSSSQWTLDPVPT